ncbi:Phage-associated homing endonuclease [Labilithrix luteola]|uniref:Phage-associated homing endonuclease n=1 Tax=Labilithrix luteola TaxID=1391654 RepID=A0A0K1PIQ5_9BACT|nr:HNH endonuclease signature motif containing protein [Labilithrix luteola]AKU93360.1 hypothetical protein AKJ09_00024 [Labilithrix luteola]AKU93428.1 Phage-associated homing endonuclease [Labilithrix luteola]
MADSLFISTMAFVDTSGGPLACHPWLAKVWKGKPFIYIGTRQYSPRRVLFQAFSGLQLPREHRVLDTCGNGICCNPRHLYGGSPAQHVVQLRDTSGGPDACWPFMGFRFKGYGRMQGGKRGAPMMFAHRIAYELANGPIPEGDGEWCVCHTCDNPPCCNPKHLFLGRDADNIADCIAKGRNSKGDRHRQAMRLAKAKRQEQRTIESCSGQTSAGDRAPGKVLP